MCMTYTVLSIVLRSQHGYAAYIQTRHLLALYVVFINLYIIYPFTLVLHHNIIILYNENQISFKNQPSYGFHIEFLKIGMHYLSNK